MKILVTGIAGFIGFHVAKYLTERGDSVVGVDNLNDYYDVSLKYARLQQLGIEPTDTVFEENLPYQSSNNATVFIRLDIANSQALQLVFKNYQFDAICHLAAQAGVRYSLDNPQAYIDSNIVGFLNILENCRHFNVKNLCFASSSSVYGLNQTQPFRTSDHTDHPISLYAATKKSNEMMAHTYAHLFGIQATGLRFFTVYGAWGRPDMAPMLFADAMRQDKPIKVFNYGEMSRDFTYIDDIVKGIVGILDNPAMPSPDFDSQHPLPHLSSASYALYNIGNNAPVRLMDFIACLEQTFGKTVEKQMLPMQAGDVESTYADASELEKKLGFAPKTPLNDGVKAFTTWYQSYYANK